MGQGTGDDFATVAYDPTSGRQDWVARYNGPGNALDWASAIAVSPDGSRVYVTGSSYGSDSTRDYATVAYDAASGSRIWLARLNVANGYPEAIGVSPDGSQVFVTGTSGPSGDSDYTTVAYGALAGAQRWVARYDGANTGLNQASALAVSPDGARLYVTGLSLSARTEEDYATLAYEASTGRELWSPDTTAGRPCMPSTMPQASPRAPTAPSST